MNQAYGRSSAESMVFAGTAMRIFTGMGIEFSAAYNASWLCPVAALVLALPLWLCIRRIGDMGNASPWEILSSDSPGVLKASAEAVFTLALIYDCAQMMRLASSTANFVSLSDVSLAALVFPLFLTAFACGAMSPEAAGRNARIWVLFLPLMLIVIAAVQFQSYNPSWLLPLFGGGLPAIAQGGVFCAGWISLLFLPWLTAVPDRQKNTPLRPGIIAVLLSSALLAALRMLCPSMVETGLSEMERAEIILSNNRVSHILQMFLTLLWFGSLLHLICIETTAAISYVQSLFAKIPRWCAALACAAAPAILAVTDLMRNSLSSRIYLYQFIVLGGIIAFFMMVGCIKRGGKRHAQV